MFEKFLFQTVCSVWENELQVLCNLWKFALWG